MKNFIKAKLAEFDGARDLRQIENVFMDNLFQMKFEGYILETEEDIDKYMEEKGPVLPEDYCLWNNLDYLNKYRDYLEETEEYYKYQKYLVEDQIEKLTITKEN